MKGEDVFSLPPDTSGACCEVADQFGGVGGQVQTTQVAMMSTTGVPGWLGESATAYLDQVCRLKGIAQDVSGVLMDVARPLKEYGEKVRETRESIKVLWQDYDDAYAAYERKMHDLQQERVDFARTGIGPMSDYDIDRAEQSCQEEWEATQAELRRTHQGYLEALDEQARVIAVQITAIKDRLFDMSKPHGTREEIGVNLFGDLDLIAVQNEMNHAAQIAPEMAAIITNPNPTPEDLEEFWNQYGDELGNPFVTNMLLTHVSADDILNFSVRVDDVLGDGELHDDILRGVGTTIALGTGGMNLDGDHVEQQALLEQYRDQINLKPGLPLTTRTNSFLEELKNAGDRAFRIPDTAKSHYNPYIHTSGVPDRIGGFDLISQLLGEAGRENPNLTLGSGFFTSPSGEGLSVAEKMVMWDAERFPHSAAANYTDTDSLFSSDGTMRDPMHAIYTLMDCPEALDPQILDQQATTADPVLAAADRVRLDSVQEFLTSTTPAGMDVNHDGVVDSNDEAMDMTRYLTGGRVLADHYFGFQDGGEQFGKVIQQASMPEPAPDRSQVSTEEWEEWDARDERATRIAGNFLIGYQDGLDVLNSTDDIDVPKDDLDDSYVVDGEDIYGNTNPHLRWWSSLILAPHVEGLTDSLKDPLSSDEELVVGPGIGDHHTFAFSGDVRTRLLGHNGYFVDIGNDAPMEDAGEDTTNGNGRGSDRAPAVYILLTAAQAESMRDLNGSLDGTINFDLDQVIARWTPLEEALFTAQPDAEDRQSQLLDQMNTNEREFQEKIFDLHPIKYLLDDPVFEWTYDAAGTLIVEPTLDAIYPTDTVTLGNQSLAQGDLETHLKDATYEAISTHGSFENASQSPAEFCAQNDAKYSFVDVDGSVLPYHDMNDGQRKAFDTYLQSESNTLYYDSAINSAGGAIGEANRVHHNAYSQTGAKRDS